MACGIDSRRWKGHGAEGFAYSYSGQSLGIAIDNFAAPDAVPECQGTLIHAAEPRGVFPWPPTLGFSPGATERPHVIERESGESLNAL